MEKIIKLSTFAAHGLLTLSVAVLGIAFSVGVGVLAGLSPANKSVKVSALTAIHNE